MSDLEFRRLEPDDMVLLHKWLNMPHMRAFYQKNEISLDEVRKKYLPRTAAGSTTRCHIAELDEVPIGKLQCYRNLDYPEYALEIQVSTGTSIDLFIGEARMLSRGLCCPMLERYLEIVAEEFPGESEVFICHDRNNVAAIECSKSVGFRYLRDVVESGVPSVLLSIPLLLKHREKIEKRRRCLTRGWKRRRALRWPALLNRRSVRRKMVRQAVIDSVRQEIATRGVVGLPVTDLTTFDLPDIEWSGSASHLRSVASLLKRVESGEIEYLALRAPGGEPVGKCCIDYSLHEGAGEIAQLATVDELQRLGLATRLIGAAEDRIRVRRHQWAIVGVEDNNPGARRLYERLGYESYDRWTDSWEAEDDAGNVYLYEGQGLLLRKSL